MVEQLFYTEKVAGSNPASRTKVSYILIMKAFYRTITPELLEQYADKIGLGGDRPVDMEKYLELFPGDDCRILEVGCGTGRLGIHLINTYDYVGIDFYDTYIDFFKNKLKEKGIRPEEQQIINVSFLDYDGGTFDVILFPWTVIGDFNKEQQIQALNKTKKLLSKNGIIILDNPAEGEPYNMAPLYEPTKFYYTEWKKKLQEMGFTSAKRLYYKTKINRKREITVLKV